MRKTMRMSSFAFLVIFSLLCSRNSHAEDAAVAPVQVKRPVALIGASYGRYEVRILINNAMVQSKKETYLYKDCRNIIPWDELDKYGLVIVATSVKKAANLEQIEKLKKYVEGGGHLMFIHSIARNICGGWANLQKGKWLQWAGIKTVTTAKKGMDVKILDTANPLLKGVFPEAFKEGETPAWPVPVHGLYMVIPPMRVVVGKGKYALLAVAKVGKGQVTVFGEELFRKRGIKPKADAKIYLEIMRNVIRSANIATQSGVTNDLGEKKSKEHAGVPVLIWNREWTRGERYGPRFVPPMPNNDELVNSLDVNMAISETESVQINLTPLKDVKKVSWLLDSGKFPRGNVEFFVQAKPKPIRWKKNPAIAKEFPYWLMPPKYVTPEGSEDFTLFEKFDTRVVWLRINTKGVASGTYTLNLTLKFDGGFSRKIPVNVKVYPVTLPRYRLISLAAAGQVYGDVNKPAPALRLAKDLQTHGVEWSLVNAYRPWLYGIIGTDKKLKPGYLARNKEKLAKGKLPMLDLSCLDPWMEQAIGHGLTRFKIGSPGSYFKSSMSRAKIKDPVLRARLLDWFLREISRYMREKGVGTLVCTRGDELSIKELKTQWLPWAKKMHAAGWDCSSTFSFWLHPDNFAFINDISKYVKLWTFNRCIAQYFISLEKEGKLSVRPDAILGTYGAGEGRGSEHRKPLGRSRSLGWESWYEGIQDCQVNPYFKSWLYYCDYGDRGETGGVGGERFVSFINSKDYSVPMADSPFWEGVRDGLEDGNLAAILSWYIKKLKSAGGKPAELAKTAEVELGKIMGPSPDAIIKVKKVRQYNRYDVNKVVGDTPAYRKAKKRVLELLESLSAVAKSTVKPSLFWNTTPLVVSGKPVAAICGPEKEVALIQKRIVDLCGMKLPTVAMSATSLPSGIKTMLVIGNGSQNALSSIILKENDVPDASEAYPGKESYFIKPLKSFGANVLLVAGPDEVGTTKGAGMFSKFLRSTGHWL